LSIEIVSHRLVNAGLYNVTVFLAQLAGLIK